MLVDQLDAPLAALADPTRRAILERLAANHEATANALAEPFPITVHAVSKHPRVARRAGLVRLPVQSVSQSRRVLERAGLIDPRRSAQHRPSRLRGAPLRDAAEWIETYR